MILNLLASFHLKSPAFYVAIILQRIRRVNLHAHTFSYVSQVLVFRSQVLVF